MSPSLTFAISGFADRSLTMLLLFGSSFMSPMTNIFLSGFSASSLSLMTLTCLAADSL